MFRFVAASGDVVVHPASKAVEEISSKAVFIGFIVDFLFLSGIETARSTVLRSMVLCAVY